MAECKCGKTWLWDWCNSCFVDKNGDPYEEIEMAESEIYTDCKMIRCDCRRVNAFMVACNCGCTPVNRKEWEDVDWESEENSYE